VKPTFSVIIATKGRPDLVDTFASFAGQLEPGDEVIILRDSSGDYGDAAVNDAMTRAKGTHLTFMQDDDVYAPGAFAAMREFAVQNPDRVGIFRMESTVGTRIWGEPVFRFKNVSTQNYVVPNVPGKLGRWHTDSPDGRNGDWFFIKETAELQGEPILVDKVTVYFSPERNPVRRAYLKARYKARLGTRLRALRGG
jgi:glycosyltransferase involved in cell wall biosynthesis